jgi:hypothetical protein
MSKLLFCESNNYSIIALNAYYINIHFAGRKKLFEADK